MQGRKTCARRQENLKWEALLSIESSILGSLHSFNFFLWQWANQIGSLQKNEVGLVRHPQLINMKQNKYPQVYKGGRLFFANSIRLGQKT